MSEFFKPYEGSHPFVFVSYAHRQSDAVVSTIRILHDKGYRVWYDEGIPAGSDWPANIEHHMQKCESVFFFVSDRSLESPNCYSEMKTAARLNKRILVIMLEDVPFGEKWNEILGASTIIPLLETSEERADAILESGFLNKRLRYSFVETIPWRAIGLVASVLMFALAAGVLFALVTGRWNPVPVQETEASVETAAPTPVPTPTPVSVVEIGEAERYFAVSFPDNQQERAVRMALGIQSDEINRWQLSEIEELHFCGNMVTENLENVAFDPDGTCRVNGAPVITGQVLDYSLFSDMTQLKTLSLICQPAGDLSGLNGLVLLNELNLSGSEITDLSRLTDLPSLEVIHLEHTNVSDLTALDNLPSLKTVTVSRDMLPLTWSDNAGFNVVLVD